MTSSAMKTPIVVGVDGSAGSLAALRCALREAELRRVGVQAVFVWQDHSVWTDPGPGSIFPVGFGEIRPGFAAELQSDAQIDSSGGRLRDAREAAANFLEATVDQVLHPTGTAAAKATTTVIPRVVRGHPAAALLDAATDADLLVVGSRGHGTFTGALLGSISQHLVTHARCPVVVVPGDHQHVTTP
jgi:nucleotide-binding universal stress UspA family protein